MASIGKKSEVPLAQVDVVSKLWGVCVSVYGTNLERVASHLFVGTYLLFGGKPGFYDAPASIMNTWCFFWTSPYGWKSTQDPHSTQLAKMATGTKVTVPDTSRWNLGTQCGWHVEAQNQTLYSPIY